MIKEWLAVNVYHSTKVNGVNATAALVTVETKAHVMQISLVINTIIDCLLQQFGFCKVKIIFYFHLSF